MRDPVVSGVFYEGNKTNLTEDLKSLFGQTKDGNCIGVVSPHAGYVYSGQTAARAIASLKQEKRFVILGPNHNLLGERFSILKEDWRTPLGNISFDEDLGNRIMENDLIREDSSSHYHEHSIEVQLPFLQYKFKDFLFVPVSIANSDFTKDFLTEYESLGKHIAKISMNFGIVASSDFSHYVSRAEADKKDSAVIGEILKLDLEGFFGALKANEGSVCGFGPIAVLMAFAKERRLKPKIIHKSNSGDQTGDYSSVVSYYAIGFS
jgi:AmmeMemoRadiSam system protein B